MRLLEDGSDGWSKPNSLVVSSETEETEVNVAAGGRVLFCLPEDEKFVRFCPA